MDITAEVVVAHVEVSDAYDVLLWQAAKSTHYSVEDARSLAAELFAAADELELLEREESRAAFGGDECVTLDELRGRLSTPSATDGVL